MTRPTKLSLTLTIDQWAQLTGIAAIAIKWRLKHGWTIEEALSIPTDANLIEFNGEALRITDWSRRTGLSAAAIRMRLNLGWSVADALTTPKMVRGQRLKPPRHKRGVSLNFGASRETGAPSNARDFSELEISK